MNQATALSPEQIAATSPALTYKSDKKGSFAYPNYFNNRTPLKVRMTTTIVPDFFLPTNMNMKAEIKKEYFVWVNSYGAVSAIMPDGQRLGLKPGEFEVVSFHEDNSVE